MDRRYIIFIVLVLMLIGGAIGARKLAGPKPCTEGVGETVTINMMALQNQWKWVPNPVQVKCGNRVVLNIYNQDEYDHGFALDAYGINKRMPPMTTTTVEFDANLSGEFIFYCSVPCGAGHFDQKGKLVVGAIVPPGGTPSGIIQLPGDTTYKLSIPAGKLSITYPAGWYVASDGFRAANYNLMQREALRSAGDASITVQKCSACPVLDNKLDIAALRQREETSGRKEAPVTLPGARDLLFTRNESATDFRLFIAPEEMRSAEEAIEIIGSAGTPMTGEIVERIFKSMAVE